MPEIPRLVMAVDFFSFAAFGWILAFFLNLQFSTSNIAARKHLLLHSKGCTLRDASDGT
jgi:hypothetical protein